MSYCVNCGVELAEGEKYCPLCDTEVINPSSPWRESASRPYPVRLEKISKKIDRKFFAALAGIILTIPIIITVLCDLVAARAITWSAYVAGAGAMLFVVFIMPFYFKKYYTATFLAADGLAITLYLLFIEKASGGNWFLPLGLPIMIVVTGIITADALLLEKKRFPVFVSVAIVLFSVGFLCICLEIIIRTAASEDLIPRWSFFVLVPCVALGISALILEKRKKLKDEIKRRLFF